MSVSLRLVARLVAVCIGVFGVALSAAAQVSTESGALPRPGETSARGESFGSSDQSVTWLSMSQFQPRDSAGHAMAYSGLGYQNRAGGTGPLWAALDLPDGAIIDSVRLYANDGSATFNAVVLLTRFEGSNGFEDLGSAATAGASGYTTAEFAPAHTVDNSTNIYVIYIDLPANPLLSTRGVRVLWRRQISPAPATATFGDVPTTHLDFRAIEALAASEITAGCGSGNFCPEQNVTRGEVAAFFARALGLHHPFQLQH